MLLARAPRQRQRQRHQMRPLLAGKEAPLDHARSKTANDFPINHKSETQESGYNDSILTV
jgi:hypothetical protein